MIDEQFFSPEERRLGLARFLLAALNHFREDAEAAGLPATAKALDEVVCAIDVEVPTASRI